MTLRANFKGLRFNPTAKDNFSMSFTILRFMAEGGRSTREQRSNPKFLQNVLQKSPTYSLGVSSNSNWGAFFRLGMLVCYLPKIPLSISQKYPSVTQKYPSLSPKNTPHHLPKIPLSDPKIPLTISQKYPSLSPKNTPQ